MAMTEAEKKEFKELINDGFSSQQKLLEAILHPIQKDLDKHGYIIEEVPIIKQRLNNHIESHTSTANRRKFNIEMWVIIGVYLLDKIMIYIKA